MPNSESPRAAVYRERQEHFTALESEVLCQSDRLAGRRTWAFLAALALIFLGTSVWRDQPLPVLTCFISAAVCLVAFGCLVLKHQRVDEHHQRLGRLRKINEHGIHRLNRAWSDFPAMQAPEVFCKRTLSQDLDLFGKGSLFHLLCTAPTSQGRHTLASWLVEPCDPMERNERYASVAELASMIEWRQQLQATGHELAKEHADDDPILTWMDRESWMSAKPWLRKLAMALPLLLFVVVMLAITGVVSSIWCLLGVAVLWAVTRLFRHRLDVSLLALSQQEKPLRHYASVFCHVRTLNVESPKLVALKAALEDAHEGMKQLSHLATQADARGSIVHPLLQYLLLWDFHTVHAMERWQATHGQRVSTWFQALGELEALASLANVHHEEPEWAFPAVGMKGRFRGTHVGHPLISSDVRVCNDVTLGPAGHFMLITGSNMSGKSTLLRSIGLNTILAQAGAPVCATSLELASFQLATSLQVQDSLADGMSFFMAELKRIQQVVQLADAAANDSGTESPVVLYLLDEILQGTNTEERQIIVQRVLSHLVKQGAVGAVTTHDLALAEIDEFSEMRQLGHFREEFRETSDGPQMTFDYQLRPGVATSTNAIKLLEIIDLKI